MSEERRWKAHARFGDGTTFVQSSGTAYCANCRVLVSTVVSRVTHPDGKARVAVYCHVCHNLIEWHDEETKDGTA